MQKFECLLCGRNKFTKRSPHYCIGGYRKHHIKWKEVNTEEDEYDGYPQMYGHQNERITYSKMELKNQRVALRYNDGKPDWTLLDYKSLLPLVKVMEQGAKKYSRDNWKLPNNNKMEPLQSAMRHLIALIGGEEFDKESGERHTGHIMANMMFYNYRNPL